jgi:hypothetical protein
MVQNGLPQRLSQRVPVSPGVHTVSGWLRTQSLTNPDAVLMANLLDRDGAVLQSDIFAKLRGNSPYAYYETTSNVPEAVAFIEVVGALDGYLREGAINPYKERCAASKNDGPSKSDGGEQRNRKVA